MLASVVPDCIACHKKFPTVVLVNGKRRNLCNRKRCPECKPFRHGVVTYLKSRIRYDACVLCAKPGKLRLCFPCRMKIRRYRTKAAAIALLGGACRRCGWSGNQAAFEFHHLRDKSFTLGGVGHKSWEVIKKELKKCELLCSNCHRIEHSSRDNVRFLEEAANYKGVGYN